MLDLLVRKETSGRIKQSLLEPISFEEYLEDEIELKQVWLTASDLLIIMSKSVSSSMVSGHS